MEQRVLPVLRECVIAFDLDLQCYITVCAAICSITDYPNIAQAGTINFWHHLIGPQDIDRVNSACNEIKQEEDSGGINYRINNISNNTTCHIHERRSIYIDAVTGHKILVSILNEHPADKAVEHDMSDAAEARKAAEKLDNFIESITDSFFIVDNNWRFIKINTTLETLMGKIRAEMIGQVIWDVFPELNTSVFGINYRQAASTQKTVKFSAFYPPLKLWFHTSVYPSAEGLTVFVKDITRQKLAEEELNIARNNLESVMNNTEDLIWAIDNGGRYIYTNNTYKRYITQGTGFEPIEGQGINYKMYNKETVQKWKTYYRRALSGEQYVLTNEMTDMFSGKPICFEISFNPIVKKTGEVTGVGCFARDNTRRLKAEQAIRDQNDRLKKIASLSSHELRRPVASMLGLINVIDYENFSNPENKKIIKLLSISSKEIDDVIRQIVNSTFTD